MRPRRRADGADFGMVICQSDSTSSRKLSNSPSARVEFVDQQHGGHGLGNGLEQGALEQEVLGEQVGLALG